MTWAILIVHIIYNKSEFPAGHPLIPIACLDACAGSRSGQAFAGFCRECRGILSSRTFPYFTVLKENLFSVCLFPFLFHSLTDLTHRGRGQTEGADFTPDLSPLALHKVPLLDSTHLRDFLLPSRGVYSLLLWTHSSPKSLWQSCLTARLETDKREVEEVIHYVL